MYFKLGSLLLDSDEVNLSVASARPEWTQRGALWAIRHTWLIRGITRASSQSALTTKLSARETEFTSATTSRTMTLYIGPADTNATVHSVSSTGTYSGVQCTDFTYTSPGPYFANTQYVWLRSWQATLTAEKIVGSSELYAFSETTEQIGEGTADSVIQESLTGTPQLQVTKAYTKFLYRQMGTAVKVGSYYAFPAAAYPSNVLPKATRYWRKSPIRKGTVTDLLYTTGWHYLMHAPTALGFPAPANP